MKKLYILAIATGLLLLSGCGSDSKSSKTELGGTYAAGESFTLSSTQKILNDSGDANVSISTDLSTGIVTASVHSGTVSVVSK